MDGIIQGILTPRALEVLATCPARFSLEYVRGLRRVGARRACDSDSRRVALLNALCARLAGHNPIADLAAWAIRSEALASDQAACEAVLKHHAKVHPPEDDRKWYDSVPSKRGSLGMDLWVTHPLPSKILGQRMALRVHVPLLFQEADGLTVVLPHVTSNAERQEVVDDRRRAIGSMPIIWAAQKWARKPVRTILWDIVRSSPPREPATLKCTTCKGTGRTKADPSLMELGATTMGCAACAGTGVGGISAAACDTTYEVWVRAVTNWPHLTLTRESERALDLVQRLRARGDTFAYRVGAHVQNGAVDRWLRELRGLFRATGVWLRTDNWPRNPAACLGRSGPCPYRDNCCGTAADPGAPYFIKTDGDPTWDEDIKVIR
jgi:hypothetical protein